MGENDKPVISEEFAAAFLSAQREMENPAKDHTATIQTKSGGSFSYSYAGLEGTLKCIKTALHKHGISIAQPPTTSEEGLIGIRTELIYKGEVWDRGTLAMKCSDDPQKVGSLITYLRRYGITSAVGVVAEDDDDGQNAQGKAPTKTRKPAPKPTTSKPTPKKPDSFAGEPYEAPTDPSLGKGMDEGPVEATPAETTEENTSGDIAIKIGKGWGLIDAKFGEEKANEVLFDSSKFEGKDGPIGFKDIDGVMKYANGKSAETKKLRWLGSTLGNLRDKWADMEG